MGIPIQYVLAAVLILCGLATAWAGPYATDDDTPTGERSPRERRLIRGLGWAIVLCGVIVLIAALLGFRPPPNGNGPLI